MMFGRLGQPGLGLVAEPEASAMGLEGARPDAPRRGYLRRTPALRPVPCRPRRKAKTLPDTTAFCMASAAAWNWSAASCVTIAGGGARQHDFHPAAGIDDPQPIAGMKRRDGDAGARPDFQQPFPGEPLDRLAHRRAAEAQPVDKARPR